MKLIIKLTRNVLGTLIAGLDVMTRGRSTKRSLEQQAQVDASAKELTLYQFFACPFCIKTRRAIYKLNVPIPKRNISEGSPYRAELKKGGGKIQAPCLRIQQGNQTEWLYESSDIVQYLNQRFG